MDVGVGCSVGAARTVSGGEGGQVRGIGSDLRRVKGWASAVCGHLQRGADGVRGLLRERAPRCEEL